MKPNLSAYDPLRPIKVAYATLTRRLRKTHSECLTSPMTSKICLNMFNIVAKSVYMSKVTLLMLKMNFGAKRVFW